MAESALVAVYLYRKGSGAISCFFTKWSKRRRRIASFLLTAALVLPAFRIYDSWFVILLHFTVFLLLIDGVVLLFRRLWKRECTI